MSKAPRDFQAEELKAKLNAEASALMRQVVRACEKGDVAALKRIWENADPKPSINDGSLTKPQSQEFLPLAAAIHAKSPECVSFLIGHGADPNARDASGRPSWHAVLRYSDIGMAKAMFNAGADPAILNSNTGGNALHGCLQDVSLDMIKFLRASGTDPNQKDKFGMSPIDFLSNRRSAFAEQALAREAVMAAMKQPLTHAPRLG